MRGLGATFKSLFSGEDEKARKAASLSIVRLGIDLCAGHRAHQRRAHRSGTNPAADFGSEFVKGSARCYRKWPSRDAVRNSAARPNTGQRVASASGPVPRQFTLNDAGFPQIELHGIDSSHTVYFSLPQTHVVRCCQDSHLLRFLSQPAAAAEPYQADHEWNAVRDRSAQAGADGRIGQPAMRRRSSPFRLEC